MNPAFRRCASIAAWVCLAVLIYAAAVSWIGAFQLGRSGVRPLQSYHQEWLNAPEDHGIRIRRFSAANGRIPCLLVTPDPQAGPAERGILIRRQLQEQGVELTSFGTVRATVVLLHGRCGRKEDLLPIAERFCAAGFRCLLPDLPAHGESPLPRCHFATTDAEAGYAASVLTCARARKLIPVEPACLWGLSMGGAFATRSAAQKNSPWTSLVLVNSYGALDELVQRKTRPWLGPLTGPACRLMAHFSQTRGSLDPKESRPVTWAASVSVPVLVAHGSKDELIPVEAGRRLFDAFSTRRKRWVRVEGGDHHNVLVTAFPLYATKTAWFLRHLPAAPTPSMPLEDGTVISSGPAPPGVSSENPGKSPGPVPGPPHRSSRNPG